MRWAMLVALLVFGFANSAFAEPVNLVINYTGGFAHERAVCDKARDDWKAALWVPQGKMVDLTVALEFKLLPEGIQGSSMGFMADANGLPQSVAIDISIDSDMFYDTTLETDDDIPEDKTDAYTVCLHELGHAMGFAQPWSNWDACTDV